MTATLPAYRKETPWITPYIMLKNIDEALPLYLNGFGFMQREVVKGDDGTLWHAELIYRGQLVMFGKVGAYGMEDLAQTPAMTKMKSPISLYLYTDNVDEFYKHAQKFGAKPIKKPEDTFWGDRLCLLEDRDGYLWSFGTRLEI